MIGTNLGHYEILAKLGEGGMGEVFRARDTRLDREVALKLLPTAFANDEDRHLRLHREAKILASLTHPHIAAIHSLEEDQGRHFLVLELVEGEDLSERLGRGPLPPQEALTAACQIAAALETAHQKGVVHRDLKPPNIKFAADGAVKVLDFGLAKAFAGEADAADPAETVLTASSGSDVTRTGIIVGTASYMSPEQARGQTVDRQTDIWAFGCLVYEMLTGRVAFSGGSLSDILVAVLQDEPAWEALPAGMNPAVQRLLNRCLRKGTERRLHDIADARIELEDALASENGAANNGGADLSASPGPVVRRRRWTVPTLVGIAAVGWLVAAGTVGLLRSDRSPSQSPVRLRSLTYSGRDWAPSAAPAGDVVALVSDRDGIPKIWLKQMAGGGEVPLTDGPDAYPRFSPDGSQILFVRDRGGARDLYRTSVVGGRPRKVLDDVVEGDWSPDGTQIAFLRSRSVGDENTVTVGLADIQTGEERILTEISNHICYGIRWSPDGGKIAVCESSLSGIITAVSNVSLIDVATGRLERMTLTDWSGPYTAIHWGPNGRSFLAGQATEILSRVTDVPGQIMQYNYETGARQPLFWLPLHAPMGGRGYSTITMLDGERIIIDEYVFRSRLYEVPVNSASEEPLSRPLTAGLGRDRQPAVSPDGSRVVFSSNRSGNIDLWIVDRRDRSLHQLTDHPADDWDPAFSPDGEQVLWSSNRGGNMEVWLADADGSGARQVTQDGVDAENPTMTPDGQWLVYGSGSDDKHGIWKIRPDGTEAEHLAAGAFLQPEVSPDGRFAAFIGQRDVSTVIQVVEIETATIVPFEIVISPRNLHRNVVFGRTRWRPDSGALVFVGQDAQGRSGIYVQDFLPGRDTSDSRRPLFGFSEEFAIESHGITPDGSSIVVSVMTDNRSLKLAEYVPLRAWE